MTWKDIQRENWNKDYNYVQTTQRQRAERNKEIGLRHEYRVWILKKTQQNRNKNLSGKPHWQTTDCTKSRVGVEDKVEESEREVDERVFWDEQNMGEFGHNIRRTKLWIVYVEEGEYHSTPTENIFSKMIEKNIPSIVKEMSIYV